MKRQTPLRVRISRPYQRAVERLDAALERHTEHSNAHAIRMLRTVLFGDVEKPPKPGRVETPE